ncbi:MAG: hypothetical protein IJ300_01660 [Clostridia bacterium]|nr:hypothetical protein [Clostridia bacterium]
MNAKKTPERFSIRFDSKIPEHQRVIEILSKKGRNTARYIADAIIAYEEKDKDVIENTVTEVVTKMLGLNKLSQEIQVNPNVSEDELDFNEISADLAGFRK